MSAHTQWFVEVQKSITEIIEVSAITEDDAMKKAEMLDEVDRVVRVRHWSEIE